METATSASQQVPKKPGFFYALLSHYDNLEMPDRRRIATSTA
jgi:hypothetical protein